MPKIQPKAFSIYFHGTKTCLRNAISFKNLPWAFALLLPILSFACAGGTNFGTLTPTTAYQTRAVLNGQYYVMNVTSENTYHFTFYSNGSSATWDAQISIVGNTGTTELSKLTLENNNAQLTAEINNQTGGHGTAFRWIFPHLSR